jgi:uncharacterized protein
MTETDLTFTSGGLTLAGTLRRPAGATAPVPAVVLVSGSGPIDRDGNAKRLRLDIQRQLAVALADAGIASLRYDKRGAGRSEGSFLEAGFWDNVDDADAALGALRGQPGIDQVIVLGHSEGALIATALAGRGVDAAGFVLLSPAARPGEDVLVWQATAIAPTLPRFVRLVLRLLRTDLTKQVRKNHVKLKATTTDVARIGGQRHNARWFREFMAYDPATDLARITAPVLALAGGKDLQAPPADLTRIAELVPGARTVLVEDLNHILRPTAGPATLSTYRKDVARPVDPRVTAAVLEWGAQVVPQVRTS